MRLPLLDRVVGRLVMLSLALLARRAWRRGDVHEAIHCDMQIIVGDSVHDDGWPCITAEVYVVAARAKAAMTDSHDSETGEQ